MNPDHNSYIDQSKIINTFDSLRILAAYFVVAFHCSYLIENSFDKSIKGLITIFVYHISCLGLPTFFMLTSLGINNKNDYLKNLKLYYIKKAINPGIVFFIYSLLYFFQETTNEKSIFDAIIAVSKGQTYYHLWYIYSYTGLIILLPFLKKLLKNLSFTELKKLCVVCLIYRIVSTFNILTIREFYLGSWVIYYILGYFLLQENCKRYYKKFIILGVISFLISIYIQWAGLQDTVWGNALFDLSPLIIFQTIGLFCIFIQFGKFIIHNKYVNIVSRLSKYALFVYLGHPLVIKIIKLQRITGNVLVDYILFSMAVFFLTIAISIPFGKIYKILEKDILLYSSKWIKYNT